MTPKNPLPLGPPPAPRSCPGCGVAIGHDDTCCPPCFGRMPAPLRDALTKAGRRGGKNGAVIKAKTAGVQWLAGHRVRR